MISSTAWIPRGVSVRNPRKYNVDDSELDRVSTLAGVHFDDAKKQLEEAQAMAKSMAKRSAGGADEEWEDDEEDEEEGSGDAEDESMDVDKTKKDDPNDLSRYNLDDYDKETSTGAQMGAFSNIKGLQFYRSNDEDPYITMKEDDDQDDEREELEVLPTDNLLICAKTEDDVSQLEAYLYSAAPSTAADAVDGPTLYVHHDLMLPSFPLCLEWLDYTPASTSSMSADQNPASGAGAQGSFVAVGTMDPEIEIWSMDVVEGLFPDAILGRKDLTQSLDMPLGTGKKKRRQTKARIANATHHVDAILGLSWNRHARNLLASASADATVKLWDLSRPHTGEGSSALRSFNVHSDKVQSVAWNTSGQARGAAASPSVLLTGSYDKTVRVWDTRASETGVVARIAADVEALKWNPWREHNFLVSLESGLVQSYDARVLPTSPSANTPTLFSLSAHDSACTTLDISPHIPGCLVTGGSDKLVKIWNIEEAANAADAKPKNISLVTSRDLDAGKIFTATFSPDDPLTLAAAGSKGLVRIWDGLSNVGVRRVFGERLRTALGTKIDIDGRERARGDGVVRLADEDEEESDDEALEETMQDAADDGEDVAMDT